MLIGKHWTRSSRNKFQLDAKTMQVHVSQAGKKSEVRSEISMSGKACRGRSERSMKRSLWFLSRQPQALFVRIIPSYF